MTDAADFDPAPLCDLSGRVVLFPVRHHSPAAARLVRVAVDRLSPAAVLIEGPADYNPHLSELFLPHRPPLAIYTYAVTPDGGRGGAYYPFCEHSPEWQAARHAHASGIPVRLIDLPWAAQLSAEDPPANRYGDGPLRRSSYLDILTRRLDVETFDDAWDVLFEHDGTLTLEAYLHRAHSVCGAMRVCDVLGKGVAPHDLRRESFMAAHLRAALDEFPGRPVLVVTGGYHSLGLHELLNGPPDGTSPIDPTPAEVVRGVGLTPYSFERLDSLTGYDAGMPNPGFYAHLWRTREAGHADTHGPLVQAVAKSLRDRGQPVSAADLIAVETTARVLAAVRGRRAVWRTDLIDGFLAAVVKDDTPPGRPHPVVEAVRGVLRGGDRGRLADGTRLPPLMHDIRAAFDAHDIRPNPVPADVSCDLDGGGLDRSRVLHRVRILKLAGFTLTKPAFGTESAVETWRIVAAPDFDAHAIESSRYGPTLADAAGAKLAEAAGKLDRDAEAAAGLLLDAAFAGLPAEADLFAAVQKLVRADGDFFGVAAAAGKLLTLFRYAGPLGTTGRADVGELLGECLTRGFWLFESLGNVPPQPGRDVPTSVKRLVDAFDACEAALELDRDTVADVLRRVAAEPARDPSARGSALGGMWTLGRTDGDFVTDQLKLFAEPAKLGDFLGGLFALAREQVQRQRGLVKAVHDTLCGFDGDEFLAALPALRLAFTFFTPREKDRLAKLLRELLGVAPETPELAALTVDAGTAAAAVAFEARLFETLLKYGVRTGGADRGA